MDTFFNEEESQSLKDQGKSRTPAPREKGVAR